MRIHEITKQIATMAPDEELVCVWFSKDDFPIGISDEDEIETLSIEQWNEVVSKFERDKWANPLSSSWTDVHHDIYKLVGEKLHVLA
jgi:hypothetical protein